MRIKWLKPDSSGNVLLLNERLPEAQRTLYQSAWERCVEKGNDRIGIVTSGSSGELGRLIVLSQEALLASARAVNERIESTQSDVWLKALPDFHVGGLGIRFRAQLSGAKVIESRHPRWHADHFLAEAGEERATLLSLVPTQLFDLVRLRQPAPKTLRAVFIGGARLEESLRTEAIHLGWPVLPSYGLTECCSQVATALSPGNPRLVPLSHIILRIESRERIEIKSVSLLAGFIHLEKTEPTFVDPKHDGWFTTEDRGRIREDGSLDVLGREQDFVKISGEGVSLARLQAVLDRVRGDWNIDSDLAILAVQDERLGAVIIMLGNAEENAARKVIDAFNGEVMPFERIRRYHFVAKVPRSPLGKLLRSSARALVGLESGADV